jgi:hypothetical protein
LIVLSIKHLGRKNAKLLEEAKQLRAAVNIFRELAMRKGPIG